MMAEQMTKRSSGILLYRFAETELQVLLVHPGGPFWARKDAGAWSIPKGEYPESEDPLAAAKREFTEETGASVDGDFIPLGEVKQAGGKLVKAWALQGDLDPGGIQSNTFTLGRHTFPEVDRAEWFNLESARNKLLPSQQDFLDRLAKQVNPSPL
jgi:predicted NUDIX family NTP pyrophosphohydrolase